MAVPSSISTASDAITYINNNPGISVADLTQLVNQMDVSVSGAEVTLLYSGPIGSGVGVGGGLGVGGSIPSWQVAEGLGVASSGKVATIGQTNVSSLLSNEDFVNALSDAFVKPPEFGPVSKLRFSVSAQGLSAYGA